MSLIVWLPLNGDLENFGLDSAKPSGNIVYDTNGKIGKCGRMDSQLSLVPTSQIYTDNMSVSFWMKSTASSPSWHIIVALDNISLSQIHGIYIAEAGRIKYEYNPSINVYSTISQWHHYTYVLSNGKSYGYVDGELKTTSTEAMTHDLIGRIRIGAATNSMFLNDIRIYDHCLSAKEVKELAKGLVLHYPLRDQYIEDTINISSQTNKGGWNNSGSSVRETNNVDLIKNAPYPANVYSIKVTTSGNCALTFGYTTSNVPSKTLTCSVYCYLSGTQDTNVVYIRSSKTDGNIGSFAYKGNTNPTTWPLNKWIRLEKTITTATDATTIYFCTYADALNNIRAFCGWQIEEKDHATPFTPSSRSEIIAYDCSGYRRNGTKSGTITCDFDSPRYAKSYKFGSNSYISLLNPNLSNNINGNSANITISVWAKNSSSSPNALLVGYGSSAAQNKFLLCHLYNSGQVGLCYYSNDLWGSIPNFDINKWYHIVYVISGTNRKIYVNGVLNSQQTVSSTLSIDEANAKLMIGRDIIRNDYGASNISDVRIYATALSAEDIAELYHSAVIVDNTGKNYAYEYFEA